MSSSPRYGSRLMPVVVDELARTQPDLVYASVPLTANIGDGFRDVTFTQIASAADYLAAWIASNIGTSSNFDTLSYMGLGDLRYVAVFLAAVKCGYKVLLPSLRNSPWMNASLLEQTGCSHVLYAPEVEAVVSPLLEQRAGLKIHPVQVLEKLVRPETEHFPYEKEYETSRWDPVLVLHSSGSTGPPRPIVMNHNTFAVGDNDRNLPTVPGRVNQNWSLWDFAQKEPFFSPFPAFHLAGFSSMVMLPIYYANNTTLVMAPPNRPPTGHLLNEIMDHFKLKSIFCPPIIAEQLVQEPGGLEKCKHLKFLLYAGGPLSQAAGDALSKVTDVCQFYGQSETGAIQALVPKREDWANLEWHPMQEVIMEPSIDGSFEMVMKRNPALEGVRNLTCNFPDVEVWRTKDLFKPHPTKPNQWRFHGRADDIIVLSNGEKFNPVPSETQIAVHPLLTGALIIGQGYPQASLILEPKENTLDTDALIDQVWPTIEKANLEAPGHAKITRDMIIVSSPSKPFERAAKGTVIRNSTGRKYENEIGELYVRDVSKNLQRIALSPTADLDETKRFVVRVIASAFPAHSLAEHDDLFVLGLDSLQTTEIVSLLKAGIVAEKDRDISWVSAKLIYQHPSISALAQAIFDHLESPSATSDPHSTTGSEESRMLKLSETVIRHCQNLPAPREDIQHKSDLCVLLTGSTGSLGTQILAALLSIPNITKIYCLDRSANAKERVTSSLSKWRSFDSNATPQVEFHQANYGKPDFGLNADVLSEIKETVNVIIHNAWKVDFNHSLESFEAVHIRGVRNFIDLSAASKYQPRIIFISSISSIVHGRPQNDTDNTSSDPSTPPVVIPETIPFHPAVAQSIGYAESKAVAEQILERAVWQSGIRASILRVGQIAGPADERNAGVWNAHEWFPLLLKTAKGMGSIPDGEALGNIDWLPIDIVAQVVCDVVKGSEDEDVRPGSEVLHLLNPNSVPWAHLLPAVMQRLGVSRTVSMKEWVQELETFDVNDKDAVTSKPAVKILDFFRDMCERKYIGSSRVLFSTEQAQKKSPVLKELGPIREEWLGRWMGQWGL